MLDASHRPRRPAPLSELPLPRGDPPGGLPFTPSAPRRRIRGPKSEGAVRYDVCLLSRSLARLVRPGACPVLALTVLALLAHALLAHRRHGLGPPSPEVRLGPLLGLRPGSSRSLTHVCARVIRRVEQATLSVRTHGPPHASPPESDVASSPAQPKPDPPSCCVESPPFRSRRLPWPPKQPRQPAAYTSELHTCAANSSRTSSPKIASGTSPKAESIRTQPAGTTQVQPPRAAPPLARPVRRRLRGSHSSAQRQRCATRDLGH